MEKYNLPENIKVFCATAKSFPEGIQEAFITLDKMLSKEGRTFYGISYKNETGGIVYKAAVSESFEGEAEQYGFETFVINKGEYLTETIADWMRHIEVIGRTFEKLLEEPEYDESYPCVEWYKSDKELMCMVRTKPDKAA
jgi:predicted transcriptional regulator YdeE